LRPTKEETKMEKWIKYKKDHRGEAKGTWYMVSEVGKATRWHGPYPDRELAEGAVKRCRAGRFSLNPDQNIVSLSGPWPTKRAALESRWCI
jgi:hypothetical protein